MRVTNAVVDATLPPEVEDRSVWYGSEATDDTDWIEEISADQIVEVEHAVQQLEQSGGEIEKLTEAVISLPTLGRRLKQILDEVLNGRGFVLIRGLPIERWTRRQAAIAFLKAVSDAQAQSFPAVGIGEDLRLQSPGRAGGALAADGRIVHLSVFASETPSAGVSEGVTLNRASVRRQNRG